MMKNRSSLLFVLASAAFVLNGCMGQQDNVFETEKQSPDEFAVYSRAPLSLPPDFGLRPPKPGATRPQTVMPRNEAKKALLSSNRERERRRSDGMGALPKKTTPAAQSEPDMTPGVLALLNNTGADQADPDIRNIVNNETAYLSGGGDESFADSILFWRNDGGLKGAVIDPAAEERRMRLKKAKGDVVDETPAPKIQRRGGDETRNGEEKGFWGSLFD